MKPPRNGAPPPLAAPATKAAKESPGLGNWLVALGQKAGQKDRASTPASTPTQSVPSQKQPRRLPRMYPTVLRRSTKEKMTKRTGWTRRRSTMARTRRLQPIPVCRTWKGTTPKQQPPWCTLLHPPRRPDEVSPAIEIHFLHDT
eukprot:scaffold107526_cov28-Attheya_sp.AAC.1